MATSDLERMLDEWAMAWSSIDNKDPERLLALFADDCVYYELERRDHMAAIIRLSLRMGSVMAPRSFWSAWAVQNAFRMLSLFPPAQAYVAQMKYKPRPRFLSGFLVPGGQWKNHSHVGSLFPQPYVETAEGDKVLLDEILGNGFSLLALTAQPDLVFAAVTQPIWDRLRVRRVAVLPQKAGWCVAPGVIVVREQDQTLTKIAAAHAGYLILLRPDHYVAACIPVADIAQGSDIIDALLRKTGIRTGLVTAS